jgi:environmental stress-induced protein Ves
MSVAEVSASGPFSRFDGITRWFAVLRGAGVALTVRTPSDSDEAGASVHRLGAAEPPLCFDGGAATHCDLLDCPTQDFNLMVADDCLPARMVRVRGDLRVLAGASKIIAVYAVDTRASVRFNEEEVFVPAGTLVWRTLGKAATVHVACAHALWMELSL